MPEIAAMTSPIQLLVEGNDQRNFFEAFIEHLSLDNIQIQNFGGVNELRGFLLALANAPGFRETVQSVGIVRDAETSAQGAFQSVQGSLSNAGLPVPNQPERCAGSSPATTVLILPGNNRPGMLETLLCQSFGGSQEEACINAFFDCVEAIPKVSINNPDKARAYAYLTTKPTPHHSVGMAAKQSYWDLKPPRLQPSSTISHGTVEETQPAEHPEYNMARPRKNATKNIETYTHPDKERVNNPPVGLVTPDTDKDVGKKTYAYDPHLDPQLRWAGKAEHTSFEVPTVSLHMHERIDPRSIIEAVRKQDSADSQLSLFATPEQNPPIRQAIEFYKHKHNWTNRLIAGDSLLVMNSLLEKEGMGRQSTDGLHRPTLRDHVQVQLPTLRRQARRDRRQG